ncbi:MAG: hypothetical protein NTW83_15280, partial [Cyanobacteria bacterium]|nr:hypothetical protein [Cyanobacteriota bacterium]
MLLALFRSAAEAVVRLHSFDAFLVMRLLMALDGGFEPLASVALSSFLIHNSLEKIVVVTPPDCPLLLLESICASFSTPFQQLTIPDDSPLARLPEAVRPYFYCVDALSRLQDGDRYLYVDADTLCVAPLNGLAELPLSQERPLAACSHGRPMPDRELILGLRSPFHYFNAGVLMFDFRALAAGISCEQVVDFYITHQPLCRFREQCSLNALLRNRVTFLPGQFNYLSWMRERLSDSPWHDLRANPMATCLPDVRANLAIVHFSAGVLPDRLSVDRLESVDHYWLQLRAA